MPNSTFVKFWRKLWPGVKNATERNKDDNPADIHNAKEPNEPDDNNMVIGLKTISVWYDDCRWCE